MDRPRSILTAFALAFSLSACGSNGGSDAAATGVGNDDGSPPPEAAAFPVTDEGTNGRVTID